jgi:hypothetical protein
VKKESKGCEKRWAFFSCRLFKIDVFGCGRQGDEKRRGNYAGTKNSGDKPIETSCLIYFLRFKNQVITIYPQ